MQLPLQRVILQLLLHLQASICFGLGSLSDACQPLLFVLGASFVDTGGYSAALPYASSADFPPFGVDYFPEPTGRWSNGRVVTDFLSQGLGYELIHPYLKSVHANFTHGANFACAGSTARDGEGQIFPLTAQVSQVRKFLSEMVNNQSSSRLRQGYLTQQIAYAIFLIESGGNDYVHQFAKSLDFDVLDLVVNVIASMETSLKELYRLGGRNFVVMNVYPVGCTPTFISGNPSFVSDEYGCKIFYNSIIELHNLHLEELLTNLTTELPNANWILFDAYSIFSDAYRNPAKYGIEYPLEACCGVGGPPYNCDVSIFCGSSGYLNGTLVEAKRCEDPSLVLSWDGIHPVESFAKYLADGVLSGEYLRPAFNVTSTCSFTA